MSLRVDFAGAPADRRLARAAVAPACDGTSDVRPQALSMRGLLVAIVEYLLGFFALAVFAAYAYAGGAPTEERFVGAFKLAACFAAVELVLLARRAAPTNRLTIGANVWLLVAGTAAFAQQWWLLRGYQRVGEASLFVSLLAVGVVATALTPAGFVAAIGPRRQVVLASVALLVAVPFALWAAVAFRGDVKLAAVLPVIGLSWLNRGLQRYARRGA